MMDRNRAEEKALMYAEFEENSCCVKIAVIIKLWVIT